MVSIIKVVMVLWNHTTFLEMLDEGIDLKRSELSKKLIKIEGAEVLFSSLHAHVSDLIGDCRWFAECFSLVAH